MNTFDENELRKKIRSELKKKHREKKNQNKTKVSEPEIVDEKLSDFMKNRIRQIEEDRLFSKHSQFIKCENHLNETKWLTALEKAEQHEYYPITESFWEKFTDKLFGSSKYKIPNTQEVEEYREKVKAEIEKDIEERLQKHKELIDHHQHRKHKNRIDEIIEQEEEAFFKSHPDYNLYKNYLGQTRWLTDEEYEQEEEFTERVRTTKEKIIIYSSWFIAIVLIGLSIFYFKKNYIDIVENGYITVSANEGKGQLYVNEKLMLGFNRNVPLQLPVGLYNVVYRKDGFITSPKMFNINVSLNDTTQLKFDLAAKSVSGQGFVKINAPYQDSKLFVDNEFYGTLENNKKLLLDEGNHSIELKKENFYITPPSRNILVKSGDTLQLNFTFETRTNGKRKSTAITTGLIEVSSNIKGATILMNRKDTGRKTDFVFNKLPFKNYIISVEREGYKSFPEEKEVKLSASENYDKIFFKLTRTTIPVKILTKPVSGKIYIDDRDVGEGRWSGSLPVGVHKIRFGDINFFKKPKETEFLVSETGKTEFIFNYESNFSIIFKPAGIKPDNVNASIQLGYVDENNKFVSDPRNGPEIRNSDVLNDKMWWLGNAFNYRIPPANEAVAFSFYLPERTEFGADYSMKVWGYDGELSYPLELSGSCYFRVAANNFEVHQKYESDYTISEADENKFIRFRLGNVLRSGKNTIVISTAKVNKTFFALWKIEIE